MRPTFLGFEASKSALFASQKALDITGNNLANIATEGYTRQRLDQVAVNYTQYSSKGYVRSRIDLAGQGVNVIGIGQTRDKQLDTAYRNQCCEIGGNSQKMAILSDLEEALQEYDIGDTGNGYGLRNAVSNLYNALQDLAGDAGSATYATVAADAFEQIARSLREMDAAVDEVADKYKSDLQADVNDVNDYLAKIADLNKNIKYAIATDDYTEQYGPNELLDQRNLLLDNLATYGELSLVRNTDGTVDVSLGGVKVVSGDKADSIEYKENSDGTVALIWKSTGMTTEAGEGILSAERDLLNGRGKNIKSSNESPERGVLYYKDKLNTFAVRLTAVANTTIPDEVDADGNVISYKKLFGAETEDGEVYPDLHLSASNIWITDELATDVNYLLTDNGNNTDNTPILNLVAKLSNTKFEFDEFYGTFEDYINDYCTKLGSDISYATNAYDAALEVGTTVNDMRDSVTGVSETEETTNMLTYNRAFQAASRMMTVMDELLDVIINQMAV